MCTYQTTATDVSGSGLGADGWFPVGRAVVYFDHPQDAAYDHALCIDLRSATDEPQRRIALELDAESARRLAAAILATLEHPEVRSLT